MKDRAVPRYRNFALGLLGLLLLPAVLGSAFPYASIVGPAVFAALVARTVLTNRSSHFTRAVYATALVAVALRGVRVAGLLAAAPTWAQAVLHGLTVLGFAFVLIEVLRDVLAPGPVDGDKLYAAVAAYLLIGLTFASAYEALVFWRADAFSFPGTSAAGAEGMVYFSLVTLSTVGYGDIVPAIVQSRVLAVLEAIVGQLYLTILLGRLVGLHLGQATRDAETGPASTSSRDEFPPSSSESS